METTIKAVALGYQGHGNVGDEAILAGIEEWLRTSPLEVRAVIGGREPIHAFAGARRIVAPRTVPTVRALAELRRADVILVAGGGLFHDHWLAVPAKYLAWTVLARVVGTKVVWLGVGVGPLRTRLGQLLVGLAARLALVVTVRDRRSADLLARVAPWVRAEVLPDPAILNAAPAPAARRGLGIIVRGPTPRDAALGGPLADLLAGVAAEAMTRGTPTSLISMAGAVDSAFLERVVRGVVERTDRQPRVERLPPDPAQALARLAELEGLVTVRLHGLILAAVADTPCLPIAYDPKVAAYAEELGLSDLVVSLDEVSDVSAATVLERLDQACAAERQALVRDRRESLRRRSEDLRARLLGRMTQA